MTTSVSGPNSAKPTTAEVIGGTYNATAPALVDGQAASLQLDSSGQLKVVTAAGGPAVNVNIADIAGNPPVLNNPLPVELSDGTNAFGVVGNPIHAMVDSGTVTAVTAITNALPAGTNLLGKVGIDQTTPGTTNKVSIGTDGIVSTKTALTPSSPTAASVGVTSASAVSSAPTRKGLVLVNTSINTISLGFGAAAAVLNSGITLLPGGSFCMDEYSFYTGAVNAIASGASSNLAIQEYTT